MKKELKIASMVVDNLDWVNYRVEYNSERLKQFDLVIWFAASEKQVKLLKEKRKNCSHPNIEIINLDWRIRNGADFAFLQDLSFRYIKKHYNYSVCAFQSADVLLTELGQQKVKEWIETSDQKFAVFLCINNHLFCETNYGMVSWQIFRKGVNYKTNNGLSDNIRRCDGIDMTNNKYWINNGSSETEHLNYVIDNGYFDPYSCYQKAKNWGRLCYGDTYKAKLVELWEADKYEEFVDLHIKYSRHVFHGATDKKVVPVKYEGEYKKMIDDLGLYNDYVKCCKIIENGAY